MSSRNLTDKKETMKELEKTIFPILVVNNSSLKPYVELFEYSPENIYQQPLGSLVGFFEVKEYSEDSAYIVNFLTSVLKKEYYINPRRQVTESLDSALHKVNLALSELAKQGNVEWLGNINAAICVLEKSNAHFSVAGSAKIFLYRNQALSDISDGLASDSIEPHPLKTFVNVSSGRLEKGDRMLITQEDIFHIFPTVELRKNFQRFEGEKFVQFLKTALSNQLEMIAAVVVEMTEIEPVKETVIAAPRKKTAATINAFSEKTFAKAMKKFVPTDQPPAEKVIEKKSDSEYTDKKTGHIYVQEETDSEGENRKANIYWDATKEKIARIWYVPKNDIRRRFSLWRKQLAKKRELRNIEKEKQKQLATEEKKRLQEMKAIEDMQREQQLALEKEREQKIKEEQELERQKEARLAEEEREQKIKEENERLQRELETPVGRVANEEKTEETVPDTASARSERLSFLEKLAIARKQSGISENPETEIEKELPEEISAEPYENPLPEDELMPSEKNQQLQALKTSAISAAKKVWDASGGILRSAGSAAQKTYGKIRSVAAGAGFEKAKSAVLPHFSRIGRLFSSFTNKQKLYTLLALALVFIVPFFIVHWMNKPKPKTITELAATPIVQEQQPVLSGEKNIKLTPQSQTVLSSSSILNALPTESGMAVVTKTNVIIVKDGQQKEYPLPANSGTALRATFMHDLALVFILNDQGKVISFSPVTMKYADNSITMPANPSADLIGTYLTYMYVLDSATNQIYRYPRATGGFGAKTNWLKDTTSLATVSDMALDDNIYVIQNNQVLKLFKGKSQPFTLEASQTPVHFDKIFTTIDSQSLYVLDTKNARIMQYGKADGAITAQYFNAAIGGGTSLSVDEPNKTAYVSTSSALISISLQ